MSGINAGLCWTGGEPINLGLDFGFSRAEANLFGVDAEADGRHVGVVAGYHW
jgi:hypothetical protein